ncbi:hypothetical protein LGH70_19610 [Hymenobacter sp. BT635]|uniref:Phage head morphogenesis domain-containing protein n=1 Tax=Hymenobacter nitidus TaxID=2880929 RepID=A0ABS8AH96_9BACT|nr:phage minor head protein [Hymenobacter nitidus]MCB2379813.1 hypothetical protein [Hymenobacter nitidus]
MALARAVHKAQSPGAGLQLGLFTQTSNKLMSGVEVGYNSTDEKATDFLRKNVYLFSAAKTRHQAVELSKQLLDDEGQIRPWRAFRKEALGIHQQYNVRWLEAEYEHAVASAQMASKWQEFEDEDVLQYETVGDSRVRPEHKAWDSITLPKSDPWWLTHYPPNGWLCRCTVIGGAPGARHTPQSILPALPEPDGIFRGNVGKTGIIFPLEHPYYAELTAGEQQLVQKAAGQRHISDLVTHSKSLAGVRRDGVSSALQAINKVHVLPESPTSNKTLPISFAKTAQGTNGVFSYVPLRDVPPPTLKLSSDLTDAGQIAFTTLHELAHFIDHTYLDLPRMVTKYMDKVDIEDVLNAVKETKLWQSYDTMLADRLLPRNRRAFLEDYLMQPYEVWARVYSQYIAELSGDEAIIAAMAKGRTGIIADQWEDEDFEPVRNALRSLFVKKGWTPTE